MLASIRIEDIDQLLDELEQLARSSSPRSRFLNATLERLRYLLNAVATAVVVKTSTVDWLTVAVAGSAARERYPQLLLQATNSIDSCCSPDRQLLAVPIRRDQWHAGHW